MLRAIRRIIRAVDMHSKKLQQAQDITAPQLVCLLTLLKEDALTMKRLSQLIDLSASTTVGVVDRLEAKGFVSRTRSSHDRRQVIINITPKGQETAQRSPSPLQSRLIEGFQKMPELEQVTMTLAVEKLSEFNGSR
ncbi:MAG: MarR family transcriptional regulator [Moraxellaceae bacterium]|nr:MarR family transcriptional regulator [Moraxellaceae bacterium]